MRRLTLQGAELEDLAVGILEQGGSLRFVAHGGSMVPFIQSGDTLTIVAVNGPDLQVGDVALYRKDSGGVVAHRVVAIEGQVPGLSLIMRGDAISGPGEVICREQILGRVQGVQRNGKTWKLDQGRHRVLVQLWTNLSPIGPMLLRLLRSVKKVVL
jgi:signal peptidase